MNLVKEGKLTPSLWQPGIIDGMKNHDPEIRTFVTGPRGLFVLDPEDSRDLVFVASGTGLAPFMSMIRKLKENYSSPSCHLATRRIYLIHGVSIQSHLGYGEELEELAFETKRDRSRKLLLFYFPTISRPFMDSSWTGLKGRAETLLELPSVQNAGPANLEDSLRSLLSSILQPESHAVYVSGHPGTIEKVVDTLALRGFRLNSDIKCERYYR